MEESRLRSARVLILIGGHLATSPRSQKEAAALQSSGAVVAVRGVWFDRDLAEEDVALARHLGIDFAPAADIRAGVARFRSRLTQRLAREAFTRFGFVVPAVFGAGVSGMLSEARRQHADMTIAHSEAGLWVARKLLSEGRRVGVDFEDWFSQDLPESQRVGRPVDALQQIERDLIRRSHSCTTTTGVLAAALAEDAGGARVPDVVPNCFPASDTNVAMRGTRDPRRDDSVSFHWFSQTIGPGRGLETLARALPILRGEWELSLRGSLRNYAGWFESTFPKDLRPRIHILATVPNDELLSRTMSHDVGLALEEPYCANKDLTASNKLFEYMRAGLAVIATRTRGQEEVMREAGDSGVLIRPGDPEDLASAMQRLIDDRHLLDRFKRNAATAAKTTWSWERYAPVVSAAVARGLTLPVRHSVT